MLESEDRARTSKASTALASCDSSCTLSSMSEACLADATMELLEATATTEQVSDFVLDFGVDSLPVNSALLRLASHVFNRMLESGMKEAQQSIIKVDVVSKEEFTIFYD